MRRGRYAGAAPSVTWVAAKPAGGAAYTRFEVMGFGIARGREAVRVPEGVAFLSRPTLLAELRGGAEVDALIDRLPPVGGGLPYTMEYRIWPGPSSNTFTAWLTPPAAGIVGGYAADRDRQRITWSTMR